jgi:uncharacterized membrane protein YfcA
VDRRLAIMIGIGLAAGFFSSLFGVGGGTVMVPLLIAYLALDTRRATATSLAAIPFTAAFGAARYGWSGHVHWVDALLIGGPALIGVLIGIAAKSRLRVSTLTYAFALLLLVVGGKLVIGV